MGRKKALNPKNEEGYRPISNQNQTNRRTRSHQMNARSSSPSNPSPSSVADVIDLSKLAKTLTKFVNNTNGAKTKLDKKKAKQQARQIKKISRAQQLVYKAKSKSKTPKGQITKKQSKSQDKYDRKKVETKQSDKTDKKQKQQDNFQEEITLSRQKVLEFQVKLFSSGVKPKPYQKLQSRHLYTALWIYIKKQKIVLRSSDLKPNIKIDDQDEQYIHQYICKKEQSNQQNLIFRLPSDKCSFSRIQKKQQQSDSQESQQSVSRFQVLGNQIPVNEKRGQEDIKRIMQPIHKWSSSHRLKPILQNYSQEQSSGELMKQNKQYQSKYKPAQKRLKIRKNRQRKISDKEQRKSQSSSQSVEQFEGNKLNGEQEQQSQDNQDDDEYYDEVEND